MEVEAVLIDLDNTLYYYEPCNDAALQSVWKRFSKELSVGYERFIELHDEVRLHWQQQLRGQAAAHDRLLFFKRIVRLTAGWNDATLSLAMTDHYWDVFLAKMNLHPQAIHVLESLGLKYPISLVSNQMCRSQLRKVARLGIDQYFNAIVTSEEAGVEKPHARMFELAMERLGIEGTNAVMIGDNPKGDIEGAHAAGFKTIQTIEYAREKPSKKADHVVRHLEDVLEIL